MEKHWHPGVRLTALLLLVVWGCYQSAAVNAELIPQLRRPFSDLQSLATIVGWWRNSGNTNSAQYEASVAADERMRLVVTAVDNAAMSAIRSRQTRGQVAMVHALRSNPPLVC